MLLRQPKECQGLPVGPVLEATPSPTVTNLLPTLLASIPDHELKLNI